MKIPRVSETIKANGLQSLKEMCEMTGQSAATIRSWHRFKRDLFDICLIGCVFVKKTRHAQAMIDQATAEVAVMQGGLIELNQEEAKEES